MFRHLAFFLVIVATFYSCNHEESRSIEKFNDSWKFYLGDDSLAFEEDFNDASWRRLSLPHDWSIEGDFHEGHPTTTAGGALPAGIGWYRKTFTLPQTLDNKHIFIDFDGVYCNSEVWINGHYLGKRPNGYISFRYDLTPYVKFGNEKNVIAVKVDNSAQPNSRWYTGSGIYRNVWLVTTGKVHVDHWGTFITTPAVDEKHAEVNLAIRLRKHENVSDNVAIKTFIYNRDGDEVAQATSEMPAMDSIFEVHQQFEVNDPVLWSVNNPHRYKAVTTVSVNGTRHDTYETFFGIRFFKFDTSTGFFLNGKPLKILGVCNHHDLGALGAAVNKRAMERQLEILKDMGCNAIRTAHNPPAPELLELCDEMGFLVMDEAFDVWRKRKVRHDYHAVWDDWYRKDLEDLIKRDRNHPSVFMWSIGNEIREQFDSSGIHLTTELVNIVKELDPTRPVTCALTENNPEKNFIYQSKALDVLGFNYKQEAYADLPNRFPGEIFIATENMSALASRGHYDMPSDSIRRWPIDHKTPLEGNPDWTVSAYDHVSAYWGSTHEETWRVVKDVDHMAGLFVWTGFDYLGEPVPYPWPARSSYYGIIDLAGFPKDAYYLYQSEWTGKPVLHIFPHWNWEKGKMVDVWAYFNQADEVELLLNDRSLGVRTKSDDVFYVMWRIMYEPGILKAISRKNGKTVLERTIQTAGKATRIELHADRSVIKADGSDLSFITVKMVDERGNLVPDADNLVQFEVSGPGFIAGVDNGYQASLEPFKAKERKAFNGLCLAIIQSNGEEGSITLTASSRGLSSSSIIIESK